MLKMDSVDEIMQLCRLCLVKDEVNIPIFEEQGDIRQIFLKISACLPVKVSREDNLPKNICDGCSCKLEALYQFWNTSANSEKKLMKWLSQGCSTVDKAAASDKHSMNVDPVILKQEVVEVPDDRHSTDDDLVPDDLNVSNDGDDYLIQQQQLPYQNVEFQFQQDELDQTGTDVVQPSPPSRKRRAAAIRAMANMGSEDEANPDLLEPKIAKTEEESEESCNEDPEPTAFVGLPSATDNEQPGPSGVGKPAADAPVLQKRKGRPRKLAVYPHETVIIKEELLSEGEDMNDLKFVCHICKTDEKLTDAQLRQHFRELHKGKRLRSMKLHVENAIQCDVCPKFFRSLKSLKEHMETHSNQFNCDKCTAHFRKILDYTLHLRLHSEENLFRCILCEFKTDSINDITEHLNNTHEKNHKYKCNKCAKGFHVQSWLQEHENYHSGERPFECEFCGKTFPYTRYLIAHRNAIHKEEFIRTSSLHECVICKKSYQHKNSLKLHMNVHTGNVSVCDICGRTLSSKEKLKFHMRTHTGYKPFSCTYCGKCFTKKPILVEHERIHTGEKPYSCEFCSRGFSQRSSLVIHMRGHTGERPYVCHLCSKGFVARAMLNIHFRTCKGME